jgi:hypothetical protein
MLCSKGRQSFFGSAPELEPELELELESDFALASVAGAALADSDELLDPDSDEDLPSYFLAPDGDL